MSPSALPQAIEEAGGLRKLYDKNRAQQKAGGDKQAKGGDRADKPKNRPKTNAGGTASVHSEPEAGTTLEIQAEMSTNTFKNFSRLRNGCRASLDVMIDSVALPARITILKVISGENGR